MASYTTNLNLKKPAGSENVAIGDINNNMDLIDSAYGASTSKSTGTPTSTKGTFSNWSRLEKVGNLVIMTIYFTASEAIPAWNEIFKMPSGFIPQTSLNFSTLVNIGNNVIYRTQLQILNSYDGGTVRCDRAIASGERFDLTICYFIN